MNNRFFVLAVGLVLAGVFFAVSGLLLWLTARPLICGFASLSWPSVEAEITQARIAEYELEATRKAYDPIVTYVYAVDGAEYVSTQISCRPVASEHTRNRSRAELFLTQYQVGSRIEVRFDAGTPSFAVIRPGPELGSVKVELVVSFVPLTGAILVLFFSIKGFRERTRKLRG